ncbi:hypothetical protein BS78_07G016500 [Paspalum vaginatum]|nr:hypothetical protein BS78_07G016500 [Paspalum vaginatum]
MVGPKPASEKLQVDGLAQAFRRVVVSPRTRAASSSCRGSARATRRPAAMVEMAHRALPDADGKRWTVGNAQRMRRLTRATSLLTILEEALLPSLRSDDRRARVAALPTYAHKLRTHAIATGGELQTHGTRLSERLLAYVGDATADPPRRTEQGFGGSVDAMIAAVRELRTGEFTVAQVK